MKGYFQGFLSGQSNPSCIFPASGARGLDYCTFFFSKADTFNVPLVHAADQIPDMFAILKS